VAPPFDAVFCDTCIGGSTVAARLAATASGIHAFYLADYAVNPLGVKPQAEVRAALEAWCRLAAERAGTLVIACNTASALFEQCPDVRARAGADGLRVYSMIDLLDRALASGGNALAGARVCLMGTQFTVSQLVYRDRLWRAGARDVVPLAATRTERAVAHLDHRREGSRREIVDEIAATIRSSDVVVLACTCFPLVADLIREVNPSCALLDPATGLDGALDLPRRTGPNRLTLSLTGDVLRAQALAPHLPMLFPGWDVAVERLQIALGR